MKRLPIAAALLLCLSSVGVAAAAPPRVVASIKPIHSLAAAVMAGVATPEVLVEGVVSPHSYVLRPSDAARLEAAEVVFWVGPALESYLAKPLASLAGDATVVAIADIPGLTLHPRRAGGVWAPQGHGAAGDPDHAGPADGEAGGVDPHLWLDPDNAVLIAAAMAETLAMADPDNDAAYRANAAALGARVAALDAEIAARLAPVRQRPFVVFHDAYQYFERHYGLAAAGSITVSPDLPPGARRLTEIRSTIADRKAGCVFREPQVAPALLASVVEGSGARQGELDPEGVSLTPGPELYAELMRGLAASIAACLGEPD